MLGSVLKTKQALCSPTDCKELLTSVKAVWDIVIQWVHGLIASYCDVSEMWVSIQADPGALFFATIVILIKIWTVFRNHGYTCLNTSMMIIKNICY